jgi:hypothetical protein
MDIFIFKTNIDCECKLEKAKQCLAATKGISQWSVDTEDCDKVLRVVSNQLAIQSIISVIQSVNIQISELE